MAARTRAQRNTVPAPRPLRHNTSGGGAEWKVRTEVKDEACTAKGQKRARCPVEDDRAITPPRKSVPVGNIGPLWIG